MKSDRRHELQTNELADWLGVRLQALQAHATTIAVVAGIVVVLVVGASMYLGGEDTVAAKNWSSYFGAFNQREPDEKLEKLAKDKPGTLAALWAQQSVGDMNLASGAGLLFSDRAEAQKRLEKAKLAFLEVEKSATNEPMLQARARMGLAKVYESLCQPDDARKYYDLVAQNQKGTAIGKTAAADAERMKDERQVALLAWFAEQKPKRPAPMPGLGGGIPSMPNEIPSRPDIQPPGFGVGNLGVGTAADPTLTFPSPGTTPPPPPGPEDAAKAEATKSDEAKADAPKADPPKAEEAKPAAEPPAAAKPEESKTTEPKP